MSVRRFLAAAVLLLVCRSTAAGQSIPSPYRFYETGQEVDVFTGWSSPSTGQFGYGPKAGPVFGARYTVDMGSTLSAEAHVAWMPTTRDVMDPRKQNVKDPLERKVGTADVYLLAPEVRLKLSLTGPRTWHGLSPIVYLGAGAVWDLAPQSLDEAAAGIAQADRFTFNTSVIGSMGAGLRWFLGDKVLVRADGGMALWKLDAPEGFRRVDRGFGDVGTSETVDGLNATIGIGYRF